MSGDGLRGPRSFDHYKSIDPQLNQSISHMNALWVERVLGAAKRLLPDTPREGEHAETETAEG